MNTTTASAYGGELDNMATLRESVRKRVGIVGEVKEQELIDHLESVSIDIKELLCSSFGPSGLNKVIINYVGDIYLTSDGKTIIEEVDVLHPFVTSLKSIAKAMDRTTGDGTKTAMILATSMILKAVKLMREGIHPASIVKGYQMALNKAYEILEYESFPVISPEDTLSVVLNAALSKGLEYTKAKEIGDAVLEIITNLERTKIEECLDLEENVKILKKVGGPSFLKLTGVILDEKPAREDMPYHLTNAQVLVLNYETKFKSSILNAQHNIRMDTWETSHLFEEELKMHVREFANKIISTGANAVFSEGDVDPSVEEMLARKNILLFKKLKMKDLEKIARSTGSSVVSIKDEIVPHDLGMADEVRVEKKNGEYFAFVSVKNQPISTIVIWEPFIYGLEKVEEAIDDALNNAAFMLKDRMVVKGAGWIEFQIAQMLKQYASTISGKEQLAVIAYAQAIEEIPKILAENMGLNVIDTMVMMENYYNIGVDAKIDCLSKMTRNSSPVYDSAAVKKLAVISATDATISVLRIDKIIPRK